MLNKWLSFSTFRKIGDCQIWIFPFFFVHYLSEFHAPYLFLVQCTKLYVFSPSLILNSCNVGFLTFSVKHPWLCRIFFFKCVQSDFDLHFFIHHWPSLLFVVKYISLKGVLPFYLLITYLGFHQFINAGQNPKIEEVWTGFLISATCCAKFRNLSTSNAWG